MPILPFEQPGNPWRRSDGKPWSSLDLKAGDVIDVLVVKTNGQWSVIARYAAIDIAWAGYTDAFVVAFRPSVVAPTPVAAGGRLMALQAQLQVATDSRDHYKKLWVDAEARRTLGLAENARLRHELDQLRDHLASLRSAA